MKIDIFDILLISAECYSVGSEADKPVYSRDNARGYVGILLEVG